MLDKIVERMKQLESDLEVSSARHNGMVGALMELKNLYKLAQDTAPIVDEIVKDAAPIVEIME